MPSEMFTAPKSYLEVALDEVAFQDWLSAAFDIESKDDTVLTLEEMGARLDLIKKNKQELDRRRARWITRSRDKEKQRTADLKVRTLAQRAAREASPEAFRALQRAGENLNPKHLTGAQCAVCASRIRYVSNGACVACLKRHAKNHNSTPWGKAALRDYRTSGRGKASRRAYARSERGKARKREWERERIRSDPEGVRKQRHEAYLRKRAKIQAAT